MDRETRGQRNNSIVFLEINVGGSFIGGVSLGCGREVCCHGEWKSDDTKPWQSPDIVLEARRHDGSRGTNSKALSSAVIYQLVGNRLGFMDATGKTVLAFTR